MYLRINVHIDELSSAPATSTNGELHRSSSVVSGLTTPQENEPQRREHIHIAVAPATDDVQQVEDPRDPCKGDEDFDLPPSQCCFEVFQ